jgi:molybdopterin-guanine dinucleotide biosynthesis protein A
VRTISVIVAGGKSRRMGRDKSAILFQGRSMINHALALVRSYGADETVILGRADHKFGLADPVPSGGPAANLRAWINAQPMGFKLMVVPVDMPLLTIKHLRLLDQGAFGGYFEDLYLPFCAVIKRPLTGTASRMKDLLSTLDVPKVYVSNDLRKALINVNCAADLELLKNG